MADRMCLIDVDFSMIDDNFTADPATLTDGQFLVYQMEPADQWVWDADTARNSPIREAGWTPVLGSNVHVELSMMQANPTAKVEALMTYLRSKGVIVSDGDLTSLMIGEVP